MGVSFQPRNRVKMTSDDACHGMRGVHPKRSVAVHLGSSLLHGATQQLNNNYIDQGHKETSHDLGVQGIVSYDTYIILYDILHDIV